jgi:hypothetical protein
MPDDLEGFAEWRDTMEVRVSTLEARAKTEARARAGMDQDISAMSLKLDAHSRLLQALADTQSQHTATLTEHTAILTDHTRRLSRLEVGQADHTVRLNRLEVGLERVHVGVQTIIGLLDGKIDNLPD